MKYTLLVFISVCLCSVYYHNCRHAVLEGSQFDYKVISYLTPQLGLEKHNEQQKYWWKGRFVSCFLSSWYCAAYGIDINSKTTKENFANAVAWFSSIIIMVTFLTIIILSKNKLLFLLGTSAALQYAWLPMAEGQLNPWDQFALLSWVVILLVDTGKYRKNIVWLIPAFAIFKETTIVLSVLILFWDEITMKRRIIICVCIAVAVVAIKTALSHIGGDPGGTFNQSYHYESICRTGEYWIIERNFHALGWWKNFNPIYFSVAGLWAACLFWPGIHNKYKLITVGYLVLIFFILPGNITEARLWQEVIPVFFVGIDGLGVVNLLSNKKDQTCFSGKTA